MTLADFEVGDLDVRATCKEAGCSFWADGDSAVDAFVAWWDHKAIAHPEIIPTPEPPAEVESPTDVPPKSTD
jgi:hypothetical protein